MVVDMGAFNLVEFAKTLGLPAPGLSVTGGIHVLQILSHSLAGRAAVFAPLDVTNKVCLKKKTKTAADPAEPTLHLLPLGLLTQAEDLSLKVSSRSRSTEVESPSMPCESCRLSFRFTYT